MEVRLEVECHESVNATGATWPEELLSYLFRYVHEEFVEGKLAGAGGEGVERCSGARGVKWCSRCECGTRGVNVVLEV